MKCGSLYSILDTVMGHVECGNLGALDYGRQLLYSIVGNPHLIITMIIVLMMMRMMMMRVMMMIVTTMTIKTTITVIVKNCVKD